MIDYKTNPELRQKLFDGIQKLTDIVALTLGPKGNTVFLSPSNQKPIATKDGYTVSKSFELQDPYENLGVQIAQEISEKNATLAGDGSTTVLVLLNAILQHAKKYLSSNVSSLDIRDGIEKAGQYVIEQLVKNSKQITSKQDLTNIATISANNDSVIGNMVSEAIDSVGKDGAVIIENSKTDNTILKIVEGFTFDSGYISQYFVTDERRQAVNYEKPLIFITDYKFSNVQELLPILEIAARADRPLTLISEDVSGQALAALIVNSTKQNMKIVAIRPPRYGMERKNILEDLCINTGATFISRESGIRIKDIKLEHFGSAKTVEVQKNYTAIIGGNGDFEKVKDRIDYLKEEIKNTSDIDECKRVQERITRLSSGIAIIYVGGNTEIEAIERRHRVEDAVEACRSAIEQGILTGGGVSLMRISTSMNELFSDFDREDVRFGILSVQKAIKEPFNKLIQNAKKNVELIESKCDFINDIGYNAATDKIENIFDAGVIDPTKVICCAVRHAVSVATSILFCEAAILSI